MVLTGAKPVKLSPQDSSASGGTAEVTVVQSWGKAEGELNLT